MSEQTIKFLLVPAAVPEENRHGGQGWFTSWGGFGGNYQYLNLVGDKTFMQTPTLISWGGWYNTSWVV